MEFLIRGELLRNSLESHIAQKNISSVSTISIYSSLSCVFLTCYNIMCVSLSSIYNVYVVNIHMDVLYIR